MKKWKKWSEEQRVRVFEFIKELVPENVLNDYLINTGRTTTHKEDSNDEFCHIWNTNHIPNTEPHIDGFMTCTKSSSIMDHLCFVVTELLERGEPTKEEIEQYLNLQSKDKNDKVINGGGELLGSTPDVKV